MIKPRQFVKTPWGWELMMGDVVRFEPPAPDSSTSHDLKIHIENARQRRDMRAVLAECQRLSIEDPLMAAWFFEWAIKFLRDLY